jgi:hypothetical protein
LAVPDCDHDKQKKTDPPDQEAHIVPCGAEDRVDGITFGTSKVISLEMALFLEGADDRFDDRFKRTAQKSVGLDRRLLGTHGLAALIDGRTNKTKPHHTAATKGIPDVQARAKSQGFGPIRNRTLQNQILQKHKYRKKYQMLIRKSQATLQLPYRNSLQTKGSL